MTPLQVAALMIFLFLGFCALRVPMGISITLASIIGCVLMPGMNLTLLGQSAYNSVHSFSLIAIPLYVFAGNVMSEGGIANKLVNLASAFVSRVTGGLGMVMAMACAFFAAISGSSTATTAAIGSLMVGDLEKRGYGKHFALALAAAGGVIGPLIPPSIGMVLYGVATGNSISALFVGGALPGILMMFELMIITYIIAKKRNFPKENKSFSIKETVGSLWSAKYAIFSPLIILGGIYGGVFTPTEAAAVACVYAVIVSTLIERRLSYKEIWRILIESFLLSTTILFMVAMATLFGRVMTMAQVPQRLTTFIVAVSDNRYIAMIIINIFLLFVGCIMDASASIIILSPILLPIAQHFGYDPVHFGVILVTNLTIGAITPPVGCCLFAASGIGKAKIEVIAKEALPFLAGHLVILLLEIFIEPVVMLLPRLLVG